MAVCRTAAASTSAFIASDRVAVPVFLAPKLYLILLGALDAPLAHLDIILDLCFRKLSVLPEDDVEAQSEYAESDQDQCGKQDFHISL